MTKKYLFLSLLIVSFLVAPLFLRAETTTDDIARQIASLKQQIVELQRQLTQLQGQAGRQCFMFNRNLGVGASGRDVRELHTVLAKEGFPVSSASVISDDENDDRDNRTDRFTETTAAAVSALQEKYRGEILTPNGLTSPTGYVGPATRAKLNQLYGCNKPIPPVPGNLPPVISGVFGPTTLNVNQTGTWTVRASDPENGQLWYFVDWGDRQLTDYGGLDATTGLPSDFRQTATFTHTYSTAGNYTAKFLVRDIAGNQVRSSLSVKVGQSSGYNFSAYPLFGNAPLAVTFTAPGGSSCVDGPDYKIVFGDGEEKMTPLCVSSLLQPTQVTHTYTRQGIYVATLFAIPSGFGSGDRTPQAVATISINVGNSTQSPITVTSPNGGEQWVASSTHAITWRYDGATSGVSAPKVDLYLDLPCLQNNSCPPPPPIYPIPAHFYGYVLDKNIAANVIYNWIVATDIDNNLIRVGQWRIRVCEAGSQTNCDSSDNYFTILAQ